MPKKRYGNELHPLYSRWLSMTQRCTNPNHKRYADWGGRGISIAKELRNFLSYVDVVEGLAGYSSKGSIDRKDNDGNYEIDNLRWTCRSTQIANQRPNSRGYNKYTGVNWSNHHNRWIARVTFKGKSLFTKSCLTEKEALCARNDFIIQAKLPHPIQKC